MNPSKLSRPRAEWDVESEWVVTPQQDRSRETMKQLLEAAVTLFGERGYARTSVVDIARKANLTTGAIYRRFADKEAILYTILENYSETRFRQYDEVFRLDRWEKATLQEIVSMSIEVTFRSFRQDKAVLRVVETQRLVDPVVARKTKEWDEHVVDVIIRTVDNALEEEIGPELRWSIGYIYTVVRRNVVMSVLLAPITDELAYAVDSDDVLEETKRMARLYLDDVRKK